MGEISAEAVAAFVAALALVATTVSVIYLAKQTSAVAEQTRVGAEQTKISNAMAAVSANNTVLSAVREVHLLMLERPGSRRYFYGDEPLPEQQDERDEILTIAELLADVMSSGIHTHKQIPDSNSAEPWDHYCCSTLRSSPALRDLVRDHPTWWPYLPPLLPPAPADMA
ncbi:hypothetical protein ACQPZ2_22025 [Nocardia pseudovaccinii]|uniref:hypothetical protein n=1 Tax=Nocardia pseudovaccinii TaxID=189540 RepID=UPI003D8D9642